MNNTLQKSPIILRASWLQMRLYFWIVLGVIAITELTNLIVYLSVKNDDTNMVSVGNLLAVFLIFVGSVLPAGFFRRIVNLGASRKEYYVGLIVVFASMSVLFAALNTLWLQLEIGVIRNYEDTMNILEIFHWNQFGILGMFVYQVGVYLLLLSLLGLLFSGLHHFAGWIIWGLLVAAIPIFTSIAPLRRQLADGLQTLLMNGSLLQGFGLTLLLSCILLAGGWLFTARRPVH